MSAIARDLWLRVTVDGELVSASAPVRIQQQLEGAVTTVAEISLAGTSPALAMNTPVTVHHVNRNDAPDPNYDSRQLFSGIVNRVGGVGFPHGVSLSCTGQLAKLRRTRPTDYQMHGKTDVEMVKIILDFCDIDYTAGDIHGWNYQLGMHDLAGGEGDDEQPYWRAGQSGAQIIGELDRVFACATIELGDGRILRFPYSRAPYLYVDPVYAKTFTRGQAGVSFYGNERDRGDLDQIQNYWIVRGLSYTPGEGDDAAGCQFSFVATANADHAALGPGVDVGPNEFSSDLIDSEALAKAVATRLMQWNNREPDTIRISCGNDARVGVGSLILVKDKSYGIDLTSDKRYLVTGVTREGDTMLLDGVGGPTGVHGTVVSHLYRQCNDDVSDVGTDPPASGAPDPELPGFPPLATVPPDLPPIEEPEEPDNTDDPFINCTETGNIVCPVGATDFTSPADMPVLDWRTSGRVAFNCIPGGSGDPELIGYTAVGLNGHLFLNETTPYAAKTFDNDLNVSAGPGVVTVSGEVWFVWEGAVLEIEVQGYGAGGITTNDLGVELLAVPGRTYTFTGAVGTEDDEDFDVGLFANTENSSYVYSPHGPPNQCNEVVRTCNNGGIGQFGGFPTGEWLPFSFAFDFSGEYQRVTYTIGEANGYMEDLRSICVDAAIDLLCDDQHYDVCDDTAHRLFLSATGLTPSTGGDEELDDPSTWQVRLRGVAQVGYATCEANPDYIPPFVEDF
ncbi:MAG TPA: hypothetical protein VH475_13150 [Tepidisphaeraceae bacterium]